MTEENERKKEYLLRYQKAKAEVVRIDTELQELERITAIKPISYDGMPHSSGGVKDLSAFAVKSDQLRHKLMKARYQQIKVFKEIHDHINAIEDDKQKDVLVYYYIKGMSWEEIAVKIGYTYRHTIRIHGYALSALKI